MEKYIAIWLVQSHQKDWNVMYRKNTWYFRKHALNNKTYKIYNKKALLFLYVVEIESPSD